ncbi:hypothetical protein SAMN04488540_11457 [Ferrimonas sediminum]|uniref:Uncharacterized protein n=1 Tax=Ferrimonas sediminum TaxID=718193 RepID=A0A1G8X374_9GAMM|nr:hypothetical protein [Ferrimonas sediminum]SDJ84285.1 hypothetical protein SAMN04488540_11457 [Ferrimonas sediminum]
MFTKLLVTLLVIVVAMMSMKGRKPQERPSFKAPSMATSWLRFLAPAIAAALLLLAAAYSGWQWMQGQQVLQIKIIDAEHQQVTTYEVHRKDLDGRRFTTRDGLWVELGAGERMEISQLK